MLTPLKSSAKVRKGAEAYIAYFENLTQDTIHDVTELVADDIHFRDPYNEVRGREQYPQVYAKILSDLKSFNYVFHETALNGNALYLYWTFSGVPQHFSKVLPKIETQGMSRIVLNEEGLVQEHEDFWDTGKAVYGQLPVVKQFVRLAQKNLGIGL